jgi:hypothetical protein
MMAACIGVAFGVALFVLLFLPFMPRRTPQSSRLPVKAAREPCLSASPLPVAALPARDPHPYREPGPVEPGLGGSTPGPARFGVRLPALPKKPSKAHPPLPVPLITWTCPSCEKTGGDFRLWSCCNHDSHILEEKPSCLAHGSPHHLHVTCGWCGSVAAYQIRGGDFVLVSSEGK